MEKIIKKKKKQIQFYVTYKRPTFTLKTHTDWGWRDGKRHIKPNIGKWDVYISLYSEKGVNSEDIAIINVYVSNFGAPKYTKQIFTEIKGEINSNKIIVGYLNTSLPTMNRSHRQSIRKQWIWTTL